MMIKLVLIAVLTVPYIFASKVKQLKADNATAIYHVWSSPNATENQNGVEVLRVAVPPSCFFITVMEEAAKTHPETHSYEYVQYPFGKYITSIGGVREDIQNEIYWMIYAMNRTTPNPNSPPTSDDLASNGVDLLEVTHEYNYLFWRTDMSGHSR